MRRDGANRANGVGVEVCKFKALLLGHLLDFERQDAQLVEHRFHAVGQHAQVLATNQHTRLLQDGWQALQGLLTPEERVALIEIVVVEPQEGVLLFAGEHVEHGFVDDADARVVHVGLVGVFNEEHVADEAHQSVANPQAVLVAALGKEVANLTLR